MNLCLGFMPYMLWQNRMMSNFSSPSLIPVPVSLPTELPGTKGARWISGGLFRQGSGNSVSEVEQSHSSNLVANKPFGSKAAYLLTFRLRPLGKYPSTLFGPGPISSTEI